MKNILITGASGFIGNFLIEEALQRDYDVYAAIRRSSNIKHLLDKGIKFIELDFTNTDKLYSTLASLPQFDFIIHNAGITKALRKKSYFEINFQYTKYFIEAISKSKQNISKFVYISSLSASGPGKEDISSLISINNKPEPITTYGLSKLQAEQSITKSDFPYLIIRPTAVFGPRDKDFLQLVKIIDHHIDLMIGKHEQSLSFIYVKDLSRLIFDLMESSIINETYMASDGNIYSKTAMSDLIAELMQKRIFRVYIPIIVAKMIAAISENLSRINGKA